MQPVARILGWIGCPHCTGTGSVCVDLDGEVDKDERDTAQVGGSSGPTFPLARAQGVIARPWFLCLRHKNLPSYGPILEGFPPHNRNVERRKRHEWMEGEVC